MAQGGKTKKRSASRAGSDDKVLKELRELKRQVRKLRNVEKYSLFDHPGRLLSLQFVLGVVRGLGSVFGATIVVAIAAYVLSRLEFVQRIVESIGL